MLALVVRRVRRLARLQPRKLDGEVEIPAGEAEHGAQDAVLAADRVRLQLVRLIGDPPADVGAGDGGDPLVAERRLDALDRKPVLLPGIGPQVRDVRRLELADHGAEGHSGVQRLALKPGPSDARLGELVPRLSQPSIDAAAPRATVGVLPRDLVAEVLPVSAQPLIDPGLDPLADRLHHLNLPLAAIGRARRG